MEINWKRIILISISALLVILLLMLQFIFDINVSTLVWLLVLIPLVLLWVGYLIYYFATKQKEEKIEKKTTKEREIKIFTNECFNAGYQLGSEINPFDINVGKSNTEIPILALEGFDYYNKNYLYKFINYIEPSSTIGIIEEENKFDFDSIKEIANNLATRPEKEPKTIKHTTITHEGDTKISEIPLEEPEKETKKEESGL